MLRLLVFLLLFIQLPSYSAVLKELEIVVDGKSVTDMKEAQKLIVDGSTIYLGPGIYLQGVHIKANDVVLSGSEGTHFMNAIIENKAAIITSGNNITIENIECSKIQSTSNNGACIRHQGENLTVSNVYFHDSEQGILESHNNGTTLVKYSRFERLGYNGRAHGIYSNGGELIVEHCSFISMLSQAHSIKSRSKKTTINHTLISTNKGLDSRLVDISNGGELTITNSILHQNNNTQNRQVIGYGLEKMAFDRIHTIKILSNLVIMERERGNQLLGLPNWKDGHVPFDINVFENILIGEHVDHEKWSDANYYFSDRNEAGLSLQTLPRLSALPQLFEYLSNRK
ncbi:right-handed parallel beta-helix repeat-containing protein [Vibrio sp. TH_r3]|uniref:right-handed parallel beta-helix repeat-containing protein n=1 Tax=Vibrio sp. TH_r3 TaxID=3082084 RepID=UPI002954DF3B|nr:right-handed parallel beta-helix repeat-containing protein [Vibrio sp. TH_r3]MDV7102814.1 right-handed parallel beta-helix repeat-containing protein [Vibrio sp. TH_r3]